MKVLFVMRNTIYVRNFESTLRALAERGHDVHVVADHHSLAESNELVERLCRECPSIRFSLPPALPFNRLSFLGFELRRAIDYLRYFDAEYVAAPKLRRRAERQAPEFAVAAVRRPLLASAPGRWALRQVLRLCDRAVPRDPRMDAFVREQRPDVLLVTPLVEPGSPQSEFLRSARAAGIRTGLCVYSWDNLTNKGLIQEPLDLVTVWNEAMKREAVELHHVPPRRVIVTGAPGYDHWFTWRPRDSRDAFCARAGLRADRPYLLYLCSSKFIAPEEVPFVRRWITQLRGLSPVLRETGVLVRPHPQNAVRWQDADLGDLDNVAVWPRAGANPVDRDSRADYFDSIYHSRAVVGVNTSAQIESAIIGRGVYTVLAEEFRETQEGTLHFRHLREANGGLLHIAEAFEEHAVQLEAAILQPQDDDRRRRFVEGFVRPHGWDAAATPRVVAAIEACARGGAAAPDRGPWWAPLLRPMLERAAARVTNTRHGRRERIACRNRLNERKQGERASRQAARAALKRRVEAARAARKQHDRDLREAARANDERAAAAAYRHYLDVRERLRPLRDAFAAVELTAAEQKKIAALAHLWEATPETIASLRRFCGPISGVHAADYDNITQELRVRLGRERQVLRRQVARELFVREPTALGGFGATKADERYNEDTLKFSKAIVALDDAAVLGEFRNNARRHLVWEIGGGWGGFAYQFKTICPDVTYVITGTPDELLVASTYLMTMFPGAGVRFHSSEVPTADLWRGWETVDFIFVPESAFERFQPPQVDLALDIVALRAMSASRVAAHIERAFERGARYFYSLLPSQHLAEDGPAVWTPIERRYWPHPVPPRVDRVPAVADLTGGPPLESDMAHLIGWRRLRA